MPEADGRAKKIIELANSENRQDELNSELTIFYNERFEGKEMEPVSIKTLESVLGKSIDELLPETIKGYNSKGQEVDFELMDLLADLDNNNLLVE